MSVIYMIRHAQASFGSDHYDRLSELGVRQAEILGDFFRNLGLTFHAVYSGSLQRQMDTVRIVLERQCDGQAHWKPIIAPEFNECHAGPIVREQLDTMTDEDPSMNEHIAKLFTDDRSFGIIFERAMLRWIAGTYERQGLEKWTEFQERVRSGLQRIMQENGRHKRIAVFTSGGALCETMQIALGLSSEETIRLILRTHNTSVSTFEYRDLNLALSSFNSVAHLEIQGDPNLITWR